MLLLLAAAALADARTLQSPGAQWGASALRLRGGGAGTPRPRAPPTATSPPSLCAVVTPCKMPCVMGTHCEKGECVPDIGEGRARSGLGDGTSTPGRTH